VKTPLSSPILLFQADKITPDKLQLFKLDSRNGQREILFSHKKKQTAKPIRIDVMKLSSDNIYQIEVNDSLEKGEYSLSPDGSNQVFCFQVY
jgi:Tol biopolymer transport system component